MVNGSQQLKEKTVLLGKSKSLVGVITNPPEVEEQRPAIILLNSGLLHRVGPNRLYVKIARKLAAKGFVVLRFDLSGIGDSRMSNAVENYDEQTAIIRDTQDVMNYLSETKGIQQFILMGLCSGGSNAFQVACHDDRVIGVNLIEGFAFPTSGYFAQSYSSSLLSLRSWWRLISGQSEIWRLIRGLVKFQTSKKVRQLTENLHVPAKEKLISGLHILVKRNVNLCFIYSATGSAYYNYRKIFEEEIAKLPSTQKPGIDIIKETDHLFTLIYHQEMLLNLIQDWVSKLAQKQKVAEPV